MSEKLITIATQLDEQERKRQEQKRAKYRESTEALAKKLNDSIQNASLTDFERTPAGLKLHGRIFIPSSGILFEQLYLEELLRNTYNVKNFSSVDVTCDIRPMTDIPAICYCPPFCIYPLVTCLYDLFHAEYHIYFTLDTGNAK